MDEQLDLQRMDAELRSDRYLGRLLRCHPERIGSSNVIPIPTGKVFDAACNAKMMTIISTVARYFDLEPSQLAGTSRTAHIVYARHVAMYLCRSMTERSASDIGRRLGDKDHTTVTHAIRKIELLLKEDELLADDIDVLKLKIKEYELNRTRAA